MNSSARLSGQIRFCKINGWQKLEYVIEKSKKGELMLKASQAKIVYAASQGESQFAQVKGRRQRRILSTECPYLPSGWRMYSRNRP